AGPHGVAGLGEREGADLAPVARRPRRRARHLEHGGAGPVADVENFATEPTLPGPEVGVGEVVRMHHGPAIPAVAHDGGRLAGAGIGEPGGREATRAAVHAAGPAHEPAYPGRLEHHLP